MLSQRAFLQDYIKRILQKAGVAYHSDLEQSKREICYSETLAEESNHNKKDVSLPQHDNTSSSLRGASEASNEAIYNKHNSEFNKSMDCHENPSGFSRNDNLTTLLDSIPTPPREGWESKRISQIAEKLLAGGDKPKIFSETKTSECQIPIYANAVDKKGLYGYTDKPTITKNALTISARGTIGYAVSRFEPFCPIVRLIVLIPKQDEANLKFLEILINNTTIEQSGVNIPQLTVPQFSDIKIPLPPIESQEKIINAIECIESKRDFLENNLGGLDSKKEYIIHKALNA